MEYYAIVLAAGEGKRMNAGKNKQFIQVGKKPLVIHTLNVFAQDDWCKSIILVINSNEKKRMKELIDNHPVGKSVILVEGGKERQDSVFHGLNCIDDPEGIVFIHDGARPFVSRENLHQLATITKEKKAAILAVPVTDTIKQLKGENLTTLKRETLWAAQTPQAFRVDAIRAAHEKAAIENYLGTDDSSLVERLGYPVEIVKGSYDNIKLTTPEDLQRAQAFLKEKSDEREKA
ncbi:2-C-methyl-D-erythritol 4-phosphate cytidylyltransferase [Aquibacillus halophilus]|uniref:2-C-methyl-D-erythritol 4-phosphate cytidylyltransferase n=1 Tax=Aquibacillus halophilus TaxID=930132 RepID=A0A6A8DM14_9BACI|nr:2-C-methyl-D-erythritol 4-phosphate cytidylyltransferase [Aquibacillus halophilus]